jgi:hypothetical protein
MFYSIFVGYILANRRSITQFNNRYHSLRHIDALFMLNNNILEIVVKRCRLLKKVPSLFCLIVMLSDDMFQGLFRDIFCILSHIC